VVKSHRYAGGKIAQRHVLYLGEINDSQRLAWERSLAVFDEPSGETRQLALLPSDRTPPVDGTPAVQVRLDSLRLEHPPSVGRVLARRPTLANAAPRRLFRRPAARQPQGHGLEKSSARARDLPVAR